jgi:hypothetical protein
MIDERLMSPSFSRPSIKLERRQRGLASGRAGFGGQFFGALRSVIKSEKTLVGNLFRAIFNGLKNGWCATVPVESRTGLDRM